MSAKYEDRWTRIATQHKDLQAKMAEAADATLGEVFSGMSSADSD